MTFHVSAWIDLRSSHARNTKEFRSDSIFEWHGCVEVEELRSLDAELRRFSLIPQTNTRAALKFETDWFQNEQEVIKYLIRLESALSAHYGKNYENGYYGTPFVEVDYFSVQITNPGDQRIAITDKLSMKSEAHLSVDTRILKNLFFNPIVSLYNDGLRAQDPKSKFLNWFTIIEEYLERNESLTSKFESRFSNSEAQEIRQFSQKFGNRGSSLTNALQLTVLSRHEKLSSILADIGIEAVGREGQQMIITPTICKILIQDRNRLFHKGEILNESRLYNFLFPLVSSIVDLSPQLINRQQSSNV